MCATPSQFTFQVHLNATSPCCLHSIIIIISNQTWSTRFSMARTKRYKFVFYSYATRATPPRISSYSLFTKCASAKRQPNRFRTPLAKVHFATLKSLLNVGTQYNRVRETAEAKQVSNRLRRKCCDISKSFWSDYGRWESSSVCANVVNWVSEVIFPVFGKIYTVALWRGANIDARYNRLILFRRVGNIIDIHRSANVADVLRSLPRDSTETVIQLS